MNDEELNSIIAELEKRNDKEKAFFGLHVYGGEIDESYVKANRKGLELFAAELLKAGIESEKLNYNENKVQSINLNADWIDDKSDFFIDFIELTDQEKELHQNFPEDLETWKDKLYKVGCIGIIILLIGFIVIGIKTVLAWIW